MKYIKIPVFDFDELSFESKKNALHANQKKIEKNPEYIKFRDNKILEKYLKIKNILIDCGITFYKQVFYQLTIFDLQKFNTNYDTTNDLLFDFPNKYRLKELAFDTKFVELLKERNKIHFISDLKSNNLYYENYNLVLACENYLGVSYNIELSKSFSLFLSNITENELSNLPLPNKNILYFEDGTIYGHYKSKSTINF